MKHKHRGHKGRKAQGAPKATPYPFAPGVIDSDGQREPGWGFVPLDFVGAVALVALAYFLAGCLA